MERTERFQIQPLQVRQSLNVLVLHQQYILSIFKTARGLHEFKRNFKKDQGLILIGIHFVSILEAR